MAFTKVTDPVDNISNLANQPVEPPATLKALFDEIGKDLKTYINDTLTVELESATNGDSGADNIGATALSGGVATTVQGIVEELDTKVGSGVSALNTHKTSADHDGRYFTEAETTALLLANQQGNHLGTWQGYSPTATDPGIQAVVNQHTSELADLAYQNGNRKLKFVCGTILWSVSGNRFVVLDDAEHTPIGIDSVETFSNKIRINYGFTAKQVISLVVCPDEVMASKGITAGSSVGLSFSDIDVYKAYDVSARITKTGGNTPVYTVDPVLSYGVTSVAPKNANFTIEITHDICDVPNYKTGSLRCPELQGEVYINSYSTTKTEFNVISYPKTYGALITYNGSSFVRSNNTGVNAAVWNASSNSVDITFADVYGNMMPVVVPFDACTYTIRLFSYDSATKVAQFRFYNAGVLVTTPDTQMRFHVSANDANAKDIIPPDGEYIFQKTAFGKMNPNDVTYSGSNFWVFGIMEVE